MVQHFYKEFRGHFVEAIEVIEAIEVEVLLKIYTRK